MFDKTREDWYLTASGVITVAIVAYVDSFLEHQGALVRLLGYCLFTSTFVLVETGLARLSPRAQRAGVLFEVLVAFPMLVSGSSSVMPILFVIWAAQIPRLFAHHLWWVLLAGVNLLLLVEAIWLQQTTKSVTTALVFLGFQWFAASSSSVRLRAKEAKEALEATHIQLKSTQSLLEQQSKSQERLRIARDLHDGIGHKLTALSLKLEHARHTFDAPLRPFITDLKEEVTETLQHLRETVQNIRSRHSPSLAEVVKSVERVLPGSISLVWPDDLGVEDADLGEQLAFCIQEGISNALRHGRATCIEIQQIHETPLLITITDNGRGGNLQQANKGFKGMNERLAKYGGTAKLTAGPGGRGAQLQLQLGKGINGSAAI